MKAKPQTINLLLVFLFVFTSLGVTAKPIEAQSIGSCGDSFTPIYEIQGEGLVTPYEGDTLPTEGVVVGDFQEGGKEGFFIQDIDGDGKSSTSDGIWIYSESAPDVNVGDYVRVYGFVNEYYNLTEINADQVLLCGSGLTPPAPIELSLPVADELGFEQLEGMLVTIPQNLVISEYYNFGRYGEIMLTTERFMTYTAINEPDVTGYAASEEEYFLNSITLDDGRNTQNPDPAIHPNGLEFTMDNLFRGGDLVSNVTGVVDYAYSLYRIQPTQYGDYTAVNDRPETYNLIEGDVKVASFNVLNYFLTLTSEGSICGPSGDMDCRGADTSLELERQRAKILAAMSEIDADIFGLMEIENDRLGAPVPDYAVADLVAGLNDIAGSGTYAYIATGAIGTDAIKQAIIYKPNKVTPVGTYETLTSAYDPDFVDTKNRPTLAQVFEDNLTNEDFVVAVNHLKSKGSECAGDPDLGDGAGNCNITRTDAAEVMVDWLADQMIFLNVDDFLIIGDLNAYDKEDPIDAIKMGSDDTPGTADDYVDMIYQLEGEDAYGYVFDGHTGYLDYALTNNKMSNAVVDVTIWHINADEPSLIDYDMTYKEAAQDQLYAQDAYRSSDHDPVIITLIFPTIPIAYDDTYWTKVNTTFTVLNEDGVLANDYDPNGDALSAKIDTNVDPTKGTLTLDTNGSFIFTPETDFEGEVTFTYRASDGSNTSEIATVTINVTNPPIAVEDTYTTDEDVPLIIPAPGLLENDSDPDGDSLTAYLETDVFHGNLDLISDGSFTYTPDPNYNGTDSFYYKAFDGHLYSDTIEVTITINPVDEYIFLPIILK